MFNNSLLENGDRDVGKISVRVGANFCGVKYSHSGIFQPTDLGITGHEFGKSMQDQLSRASVSSLQHTTAGFMWKSQPSTDIRDPDLLRSWRMVSLGAARADIYSRKDSVDNN